MNEEQIKALIRRRRRQVWIHSILYYRLNTSIVSDAQYDAWARELAELQATYPDLSDQVEYYDKFKDWGKDGNYSGFTLPLHDPKMVAAAQNLYAYHLKRK